MPPTFACGTYTSHGGDPDAFPCNLISWRLPTIYNSKSLVPQDPTPVSPLLPCIHSMSSPPLGTILFPVHTMAPSSYAATSGVEGSSVGDSISTSVRVAMGVVLGDSSLRSVNSHCGTRRVPVLTRASLCTSVLHLHLPRSLHDGQKATRPPTCAPHAPYPNPRRLPQESSPLAQWKCRTGAASSGMA